MLKKILSIILSVAMLCSMTSIIGVSAAEKTEWVENFDSYTSDPFLWREGANYYENTTNCHSGLGFLKAQHLHFNDNWVFGTYQDWGEDSSLANWDIKTGDRGKKNSDVSMWGNNLNYVDASFVNDFGGVPQNISESGAIGFSFEWYDNSGEQHPNHRNLDRYIYITATLTNGEEDITVNRLPLGTIIYDTLTPAVGSGVRCGMESWNDFIMYVSKDTVKMRGASECTETTFNISDYNPSTSTWTAGAAAGYSIKEIHSVELRFDGFATTRDNGIDNLKVWKAESIPTALPEKGLSTFMAFTSIGTVRHQTGVGNVFKTIEWVDCERAYGARLYGNSSLAPNMIKASIVIDDNDTVKSDRSTNSWFKITCDPAATVDKDAYFEITEDILNYASRKVGDVIALSYDIKLKPDAAATNTASIFRINCNYPTGKGSVLSIAADGTILDANMLDASLAKLNANEWYNVDVTFTLKESATEAKVYINGALVSKKDLNGAFGSGYGASLLYVPQTTETASLANIVYLDNISYQVFENGEGAYNYDKALKNTSNNVIKMANADFNNGIISPVAADWTVGDFNALGIENASVVDNSETVVANETALIKDYKIKITGDYGKTMYYTVSADGATRVGKDHLVIVKQGDVKLPNGEVNTASAISAKAYNTAGVVTVITAEYEGDVLVATKIGEDLTPSKAGNTIKVFALTNLNTLVPIAPHTAFTVE